MQTNSEKVEYVQKRLSRLSVITFFKKYRYRYDSRNVAQEDLRKCLDHISRSVKAKAANNMFKSKQAEDFWQKLEKKQLNDDVNFSKEKHNKKLIINVLREHDAVSGLMVSKTEGSIQQTSIDDDPPNGDDLSDEDLSNEDLSDDEDLTNDEDLSDGNDLSNNDDLSNDKNDDFSNGGSNSGKNIEYENEDDVEVADLCEPHVMEAETGKVLTSDEWAKVRALVKSYRLKIPKTRCQHGPTTKLLNRYIPSMRRSLPDVSFDLPSLSAEQDKFFDELLAAEDLQDVRASTSEQRNAKKLVDRINDSINCPNKDNIPEYEHTMRNVIPFVDASIRDASDYVIRYFESTLRATAIRRNSGGDPTERARMGYRVDVLVKFNGLHWSPDLGCGEISGGLPRCSSAKEWMDTLKLGWELRDVWALTQDQLNGVDASNLIVWGFAVVARTIRIYALTAAGGLFHLILAYEAPMPSSRWDKYNIKIAYCTFLGLLQKLDATKKMLVDLNNERIKNVMHWSKTEKVVCCFSFPTNHWVTSKKKEKIKL
ncbi:130_t:CDS:2 [Funneliformis mosseae]|uniref:130_t:CDS:1 n=1 Tax=Funneliformis mosseae TaxID=27381 RepID=A0A9N9ERY8_FUNMO|nr:130_t:CDS:2 [Funneliformis mosseae]